MPTFLVGGAAASSIGSGLRGAVSAAGGSAVAGVIATAVIFALLAAASWAIRRGAVARRAGGAPPRAGAVNRPAWRHEGVAGGEQSG